MERSFKYLAGRPQWQRYFKMAIGGLFKTFCNNADGLKQALDDFGEHCMGNHNNITVKIITRSARTKIGRLLLLQLCQETEGEGSPQKHNLAEKLYSKREKNSMCHITQLVKNEKSNISMR